MREVSKIVDTEEAYNAIKNCKGRFVGYDEKICLYQYGLEKALSALSIQKLYSKNI